MNRFVHSAAIGCASVLGLLLIDLSALAVASLPPPTLSLSANDDTAPTVFRGQPVLLRLGIVNEHLLLNPASTNTQLIAASNTWADAVTVALVGPGGAVSIPMTRVNEPATNLLLTSESAGETGWWIAPAQTGALPPGQYTLHAVLNTTNSLSGWQGVAKSRSVNLTVMDEPGALSSEQFATKQLLAADYAASQNNFASAAGHLNQLLATQPDNITARTRIGDLHRASQQLPEALASYQSALATYFTVQSANSHAEPPGALLRKRRQLLTQLVFPAPRYYLPLQAVAVGPNTIALRWAAEMGRHYDIESSVNLQTWAPLQTDLVATNTTQAWLVPATGQKRFFRVIASNPGP